MGVQDRKSERKKEREKGTLRSEKKLSYRALGLSLQAFRLGQALSLTSSPPEANDIFGISCFAITYWKDEFNTLVMLPSAEMFDNYC